MFSYCYHDNLHHSVIESIATALKTFPNGVAILSNSAGSIDDENYAMADKTEKTTGIPVIRHLIKKPGCLKEVIDYFEKSTSQKIEPHEICVIGELLNRISFFAHCLSLFFSLPTNFSSQSLPFYLVRLDLNTPITAPLPAATRCFRGILFRVGDRLLTDVVFANQNNMISILVDPLSEVIDHPVAIVFR